MDYLHTHPNPIICYQASDIVLSIVYHTTYLFILMSEACTTLYTSPTLPYTNHPTSNQIALCSSCQTVSGVSSSALEAETGGLFLGA